jgi:lysozyme family protein
MADFDVDYKFLMSHEDPTQAHKITPDAPPGAYVISGINSAAFPSQFAAIAAIPQDQRGSAVENFYQTEFFNKWEAQLSDPVEERILDAMVNEGPVTGVKDLQNAINSVSGAGTVAVDGQWGPATVAAANACAQDALVAAIRATRKARYIAIVAAHPEDSKYEAGWLARAGE